MSRYVVFQYDAEGAVEIYTDLHEYTFRTSYVTSYHRRLRHRLAPASHEPSIHYIKSFKYDEISILVGCGKDRLKHFWCADITFLALGISRVIATASDLFLAPHYAAH